MASPKTAEDTRRALRSAMKAYENQILDRSHYHERSGIFRFLGRITAEAVLKLAGIKSRSTLQPEYHKELREELSEFLKSLKKKTGKVRRGTAGTNLERNDESFIDRTERMAQAIAALEYAIIAQRAADPRTNAPERAETSTPYAARERRRRTSPARR